MLSLVTRSFYRQRIRFLGRRQAAVTSVSQPDAAYVPPRYLAMKRRLTEEEVEAINAGGVAPAVHWSKIRLATK